MDNQLTTQQQQHRKAIKADAERGIAMAREGFLLTGQALLDAQSHPELYPEFTNKNTGRLNMRELMKEEFGLGKSSGYERIDFTILHQKLSAVADTLLETREHVRALAPFKNDDEKLDAILERAREVSGGSMKLSAPELQECVDNIVKEQAPEPPKVDLEEDQGPAESEPEDDTEARLDDWQKDFDQLRDDSGKHWEEYHESFKAFQEEFGKFLNGLTQSPLSDDLKAIGKEFIKDGYRAMAKRYHPDHGGKPEDMVKVNQFKDFMLSFIQ